MTNPIPSLGKASSVGALLVCGLFAALSSGCTQTPTCSALGNCGGPVPLGDWVLGAGHPACSEDLYIPEADTRLQMGDQPAARLMPAEEALYDWCDLLVTNGGTDIATIQPTFSYPFGTIGVAFLHYDPIAASGYGTYAAGLTRTGRYTIQFPAYCVRAFGATDNRPVKPMKMPTDPPAPIGDVCAQMQAQLTQSSAHKDLLCAADSTDPGGCICQFDVQVQSGGSGTYQVLSNGTLVHQLNLAFPSKSPAAAFPMQATYCNKGTSLQLTGANGTYLFDQPGLRTMDLAQTVINCTDGVKGPGEDGVDCGLACPMACP